MFRMCVCVCVSFAGQRSCFDFASLYNAPFHKLHCTRGKLNLLCGHFLNCILSLPFVVPPISPLFLRGPANILYIKVWNPTNSYVSYRLSSQTFIVALIEINVFISAIAVPRSNYHSVKQILEHQLFCFSMPC